MIAVAMTAVGSILLFWAGYAAGVKHTTLKFRAILFKHGQDRYDTGLKNGVQMLDRIRDEKADRMSDVKVLDGWTPYS